MIKKLRALLISVSLVAVSSLAQASFTYSILGPATTSVGDETSFNFHLAYSPIDISLLDNVGGWVDYSFSGVSALNYSGSSLDIYSLSGSTLTPMAQIGLERIRFSSLSTDLSKPFEVDVPISWTFGNAGNFLFHVGGQNLEELIRSRTALCYSHGVECARNEALDDSMLYSSYSEAYKLVTVSAVPELETAVLMLGGLGLVGAWLRRRKKAKICDS
jgi:hypothetical protein